MDTTLKSGLDAGSRPGNRYDELAPLYESGGNAVFYQRVAEYLTPAFNLATTGQALDLGCGSGLSTDVWAARSPQLSWTGVDVSNGMLGLARTKPRNHEVRFAWGEAEELPFGRDEFTAVGSSFALHWMKTRALEESRRVLRPGGLLALAIPLASTGSNRSGNRQLLRWIWKARGGMTSLRSQGLRLEELEKSLAGWRIERLEEMSLIEHLGSSVDLWNALKSRGSWNAIAGDGAPGMRPSGSEPLEFEWRLGLITARKVS